VAIVFGSMMIAGALYFGLRERSGERPVPVVVTPMATPVPVATPVVPGPPSVITPEMQAHAFDSARAALESYRAEFVARCWNPAVAKQPEPAWIPLSFNLAFGADGRIIGIGIAEDHNVHRADVGMCMRTIPLPLTIPAPGLPITIEVPFSLP